MAKPYSITIINGEGQEEIVNGSYSVTASVNGYDNLSVDPNTIVVDEDTSEYELKIAATGTLKLHVSDDGTTSGEPIIGAKFVRCDSIGNTYGDEITAGPDGVATFLYVPYGTNAPTIYYKQTQSDGDHDFDGTIQEYTMEESEETIEVFNEPPQLN